MSSITAYSLPYSTLFGGGRKLFDRIHSLTNSGEGAIIDISVEDAIRMMTVNGAWSPDADAERGSIEVGKYANFIFADGNPFETALPDIQAINVTDTFFEGKRVYSR